MPSSKHWKIWLGLPLLAACLALLAQWGWSMASEARIEAQCSQLNAKPLVNPRHSR